jgi:hypothetical protein
MVLVYINPPQSGRDRQERHGGVAFTPKKSKLYAMETLGNILQIVWQIFLLLVLLSVYFQWVRWIANTAEKAGRSRKSFMWFGILFPLIATFVVIVMKPDTNKP